MSGKKLFESYAVLTFILLVAVLMVWLPAGMKDMSGNNNVTWVTLITHIGLLLTYTRSYHQCQKQSRKLIAIEILDYNIIIKKLHHNFGGAFSFPQISLPIYCSVIVQDDTPQPLQQFLIHDCNECTTGLLLW